MRSASDVADVRHAVRRMAGVVGLSTLRTTKAIAAASELARNALEHGGGGEAIIEVVTRRGRTGLLIDVRDKGPGIPDLVRALEDGYTTGRGLGLGLGGAQRLADSLEIETSVGEGTRIRAVLWA